MLRHPVTYVLVAFLFHLSMSVSQDILTVGATSLPQSLQQTPPPPPAPPSPIKPCDRIRPEELPEECTCRDDTLGPHSLVIECLKPFVNAFMNDTIGIKLVVEPCNALGSSISLDITDTAHNIDYPISRIRAGEQQIYPIPGLSVVVPQLGHVGIDAVVFIAGNPDLLLLKVGLDACLAVRTNYICAESLPYLSDLFPWWVLSGTYTFGDMCNNYTEPIAVLAL